MQNLNKNSVHRPLYLLLALSVLGPIVTVHAEAQAFTSRTLWELLHAILFSFIAFVWYCRDSDARGYRRSLMRNIGFNCLAIVFVPYYLVRSRERGQKGRALLRLAGFGVLLLIAAAIGLMAVYFKTA